MTTYIEVGDETQDPDRFEVAMRNGSWPLAYVLYNLLPWPDFTGQILLKYPGDADDLKAVQEMLIEINPVEIMPADPKALAMARSWCARLAMQLVIEKTACAGE